MISYILYLFNITISLIGISTTLYLFIKTLQGTNTRSDRQNTTALILYILYSGVLFYLAGSLLINYLLLVGVLDNDLSLKIYTTRSLFANIFLVYVVALFNQLQSGKI